MPDSFNHDVHMTGFYTNISSSFVPCTINKKGAYFVTVHTRLGHVEVFGDALP